MANLTGIPRPLDGMPHSAEGLTRDQLIHWLAVNDRGSTFASGECNDVGTSDYCTDDQLREAFNELAADWYHVATAGRIPDDSGDAVPMTLSYVEAHETVDDAARAGALARLAAHWELAGHWNENAEWTADQLHQHVDDMTAQLLEAGWDSRDGSNPPQADDDSDTGLPAFAAGAL